jgi:hypothetical protein
VTGVEIVLVRLSVTTSRAGSTRLRAAGRVQVGIAPAPAVHQVFPFEVDRARHRRFACLSEVFAAPLGCVTRRWLQLSR